MLCRTCLIPDTRPDTHFDETGQCSACRTHANRPLIDWSERRDDLVKLLDRFDGEVLVPSSGGKDSTAQVIKLLQMGADVTIVTARTCHLTPIGRMNIDNLSRFARTVEYVPNMAERAELNRMGLDLVGDISLPEHWAIFSTPFRAAVDLNRPLIMYGENPQNQYGGPQGSEQAREMTKRWRDEFGGFNGMRPSDVSGIDTTFYTPPSSDTLAQRGVEAHFLGQYLPWSSHENADLAMKHGFQTLGVPPSTANWWIFENVDQYQTLVHDSLMWAKYGYTRGDAQLSVDVRTGRMSLDQAKAISKKQNPMPMCYMGKPLREILDNIGVSISRYTQVLLEFGGNHAVEVFKRSEEADRGCFEEERRCIESA